MQNDNSSDLNYYNPDDFEDEELNDNKDKDSDFIMDKMIYSNNKSFNYKRILRTRKKKEYEE